MAAVGTDALGGLKVLNLSQSLGGAYVGQFFAEFGAEVVLVEPKGGHPLRGQAGWPIWARGSKSLVADLDDPAVQALAREADLLIDTFRPGVLERHGLGHEALAAVNPGLVTIAITAFGREGPLSRLKGYEGVVMAKIGAYAQFGGLAKRPGPGFATVPYCTVSAAELAITGALAALHERETSGLGQRVDATLVQGIAAHDTWNWMISFWAAKFPEAFTAAPVISTERKVPNSWLSFGLLQGLTKDGRWLQFSQATPKLFQAFLVATGLNDPAWDEAWADENLERREAFWERLLGAVRAHTVEEWKQIFDAHPNVFAEIFRSGTELLSHPQMLHDQQVCETEVEGLGRVRAPKPFVRLARTPGSGERPLPGLDEHGTELRARAAARPPPAAAQTASAAGLPLAGVTIVDLGNFYAAPYGLSVLADLGARVIKIEPPEGDSIRFQVPFPEIGGVKVMQGKECVAIDLAKPGGLDVLKRIVAGADLVLHNFRGGVAERLGVDEAAIRAINPDVIYHEAPGFGTSGPYARRPAYSPTIGAGSGMARRNAKTAVDERPDMTIEEVKDGAIRLTSANLGVGHSDGFSALGVACAAALALLARKRGLGGQGVVTTMLWTLAQVLSEDMVEYAGRPEAPTADAELMGFSPLYRLYQTAEGWVFFAAPTERDWGIVTKVFADAGLDDPRFATAAGRAEHAGALAARLQAAFRQRAARDWERELTAADLACAACDPGPSHNTLMSPGGLAHQLGMVTEVDHPIFGEHPRLTSVLRFSRSATRAEPSAVIGQHTRRVLDEHGYSEAEIGALAAAGVVGLG